MAESRKETGRHAKQAAEETGAALGEASREAEKGAAEQQEAVGRASHRVERVAEAQSEAMSRTAEDTAASTERLAAGTAEAMTRSGTALAHALQEAGRIWVELTQDAMRQSLEATESLLRCRNLGEIMHTQGVYMRSSLDSFLDKGARISDVSLRIIAEATQPLAAQLRTERGETGRLSRGRQERHQEEPERGARR